MWWIIIILVLLCLYLCFCTGVMGEFGRKLRFAMAYEGGIWALLSKDNTKSGSGSDMGNTEVIRSILPQIIKEYNIKSLVDCGCGDMNWISSILPNLNVKYCCIDIYTAKNFNLQAKYPQGVYIDGDIVTMKVPPTDLVLCKEVFIHLSNDEIGKAIKNIGSDKLLLVDIDPKSQNRDLLLHGRKIDLSKEPFGLKLLHIYPSDGKDQTYGLFRT